MEDINVKNENSSLGGRFKRWLKSKTSLEVEVPNADVAYSLSTFGKEMDKIAIIKMHQEKISTLIREKSMMATNDDSFADYRCVYSFPKNVEPCIDEILSFFVKKGYKIINLSEKVDEIKNDHVYLISWYRESI